MENYLSADYKLLDSSEVLMYLFHPRAEMDHSSVSKNSTDIRIPVEKDVFIHGRLHLKEKGAPTILFFHGNGEIVSDYDGLGPLYNQIGINFLPVDYRGYGQSTGTPSASAMMKDCHTILKHVLEFLSSNDFTGPLLVMGRSLGSASVVELASHYPKKVKGLIVESGFAYTGPLLSLLGVNLEKLGFKENKGFGNLDKIKDYHGPTLIIHAERDHIIPYSDGQALFEASPATQKKLLKIPKANHNDIFIHGFKEYMMEVKKLADSASLL